MPKPKKPDPFTKTGKTVHVVFSHATTGSGTLTYPEDFRFIGAFESADEAAALVKLKNEETLEREGIVLEEEDEGAREDEMMEALESADADVYIYESFDVLKMK